MQLKVVMTAVVLAFLTGCDYTVSLVKTPELPIDKALLGAWSQSDGNEKTERLLVLPLGPNEYLVSFPAGEKNAMFARACLCRAEDRTLVQLTWFGTAQGVLPEDSRVYQYATYSVKGDTLYANLLNADVVKRDIATSEALLQAIAANKDKPDLFRETMIFKKEKPPADPNAQVTRPPIPAAWR